MKTNKKTRLFLLTVAILLAVGFAYPSASQAALVPCGTKGGNACTLCDFIVGMHKIIAWGRNVSISVGLLVITVAGIMYIISSGNSSLVEKAKAAIKNVIIGMVVLLTAWVVINYGLFLLGANNNIGLQTGVDGNLSEKWWQANLTCVSQTSLVTTTPYLSATAAEAVLGNIATWQDSNCGNGIIGRCYSWGEIEQAIDEEKIAESDVDKYFTDIGDSSSCWYGEPPTATQDRCLVPKVKEGMACSGTMVVDNQDGIGPHEEVTNGTCAPACSGTPIDQDEENNPLCRDELKCCLTVAPSAGVPATGCSVSAQCNAMYTNGCPSDSQPTFKPEDCTDCNNCVDVQASHFKSSTWNKFSNNNGKLSQSYYDKLKGYLDSQNEVKITEAWPPAVHHSSACHRNGGCADLGYEDKNYSDPNRVAQTYKALKALGINVLFETASCSTYVTAYKNLTGSIMNCSATPTMTSAHFHVY